MMKNLEDYTEIELKEMFLDIFFFVFENRPSWLEEAIARKKMELKQCQKQK